MIHIEGYWLVNGTKSDFIEHKTTVKDIDVIRKQIMQQNKGKQVYFKYTEK